MQEAARLAGGTAAATDAADAPRAEAAVDALAEGGRATLSPEPLCWRGNIALLASAAAADTR